MATSTQSDVDQDMPREDEDIDCEEVHIPILFIGTTFPYKIPSFPGFHCLVETHKVPVR